MSRIIEFILEIYVEYNSFSNYYIIELSSEISVFQLINFFILLLILIYYSIKFFIEKYKLYSVLVFIIKRLIISLICVFILYTFSDTVVCDPPVNKNLNNYLDQLDPKTKKYIGIACFTFIGGYCVYKCVPLIYKKLCIHSMESLPKNYPLNKYQLELIAFHDYWTNNKFTSKQLSIIYRNWAKTDEYIKNTLNFNLFIDIFKIHHEDKINGLLFKFNEPSTIKCNVFLSEFADRALKDGFYIDLQNKLDLIYVTIKNNHFLIKKISRSDYKYNISSEYMLLQYDLIDNLEKLNYFYINSSHILEPIYKDLIDGALLNEDQQHTIVQLITILDEELNNLDFNAKLLTLKLNNIENFCLPYVMYEPIFQTDSIDFLQVTGISLGYIFFYPVLYCSNKILGTVNPLSSKAFYDAVWYIFTLKFLF